jgi:hypothetical protein
MFVIYANGRFIGNAPSLEAAKDKVEVWELGKKRSQKQFPRTNSPPNSLGWPVAVGTAWKRSWAMTRQGRLNTMRPGRRTLISDAPAFAWRTTTGQSAWMATATSSPSTPATPHLAEELNPALVRREGLIGSILPDDCLQVLPTL